MDELKENENIVDEEIDEETAVDEAAEPTEAELAKEEEVVIDISLPTAITAKMSTVVAFLNMISNFPVLTKDQERELFCLYSAGDPEARETLINCNLKLVFSVAKRIFMNSMFKGTCELMDLVSEGTLGLFTAIDRFDIDKGFKFSTYATWWIRQAIDRALNQSNSLIRKPVHVVDRIKIVKRAEAALLSSLSRMPTEVEISEYLEGKFSPEKITEILKVAAMNPSSLDSFIGEGEDAVLGDFVASPEETPAESYDHIDARRIITESLARLKPIQRRVMELRYYPPKDTDPTYTLEECAVILHNEGVTKTLVTRERVRQVEETAIDRLKNFPALKQLRREY